ncbi:MAG: glycosyltransferase [Anaerolineaceae bacterium]|nr:glycosyltransferase [Anaerolineaceae bacterium]
MRPKISVIVPVYNVERYLGRCLDSILGQSFPDFELIVVDDGSADNSGHLCNEYAKGDHRIKVIHKENAGLSSARNAGLDAARGEYIAFVDSDDWIEPDMLELLYRECTKNQLDIAVCGINFCYSGGTSKPYSGELVYLVLDNSRALSEMWAKSTFTESLCNKLFKACLFDNIRFPVGKVHEDTFVTYRLIHRSRRTGCIPERKYNYFQRQDGIMGSLKQRYSADKIEALDEILDFIHTNHQDIYFEVLAVLTLTSMDPIARMCEDRAAQKENRPYIDSLRSFLMKNKADILRNGLSTRGFKMLVRLFAFSPDLCMTVEKLYRKVRSLSIQA